MEIDKVLLLVTTFNSSKIIDRVDWISNTLALLTELDNKYAKKYRIINKHLETKILDPGFASLFESYPADEDRLTALLKYYGSQKFKDAMMNVNISMSFVLG
jgi:hypothetical protein